MTLRQFEPETIWSDKNGLLTERAKGYLRGLWDYIGAGPGVVPPPSLGSPGGTTKYYRADGAFVVPNNSVVEDEGVVITPRTTLNFVGVGVTVADVGSKTTVTVAGVPTTAVATSGTTVTVPKATAALVGTDVTYILTVPGWVDIATQGGDTVQVDGSQTTIRLDNDGASLTLRYLSTSTLGIV